MKRLGKTWESMGSFGKSGIFGKTWEDLGSREDLARLGKFREIGKITKIIKGYQKSVDQIIKNQISHQNNSKTNSRTPNWRAIKPPIYIQIR